MKRFIQSMLSLFPFPFLFHFYEYNSHLSNQEASFLFPLFLFFIIGVGIVSRNVHLPLFIVLNFLMTALSLMLGHFFIDDDGSWFKPFGRDVAIIFVSFFYVLGQLIIRGIRKGIMRHRVKD
ncbi:hypothetical protein RKS58_06735 [Lysinibacillus capsici]|uniref:hypothetical protein n=1 Tax=Lysinibacillus capsici TaxID=2115968 RepID=UPI0028BE9082|nr:hypothetical protein [Lysinibacillus capsici]MED4552942.1 hypothetical protein [Lysinibacillus capsici]WNN77535.1 hypothetical protein RKS58_06735 [Lysinibacillus capsici]